MSLLKNWRVKRACNNIRRHWLICTNFSGKNFSQPHLKWSHCTLPNKRLSSIVYHSLAYISTYIPSTYFYKEQKGGVQENGIIISFLENWDHFKYRDDSSFLVCLLTYLIIETV